MKSLEKIVAKGYKVKITLDKLLKIGQYIMALTNPQWNRVEGSPEDYDTLAPEVTYSDIYLGDQNYNDFKPDYGK